MKQEKQKVKPKGQVTTQKTIMKSTKTTEPAPALAEVFCQTSSVEITLEEFRQTRKELSKKAEAWANSDKGRKRGNTRIAK